MFQQPILMPTIKGEVPFSMVDPLSPPLSPMDYNFDMDFDSSFVKEEWMMHPPAPMNMLSPMLNYYTHTPPTTPLLVPQQKPPNCPNNDDNLAYE
eukprot:Awhi_evm1s6141